MKKEDRRSFKRNIWKMYLFEFFISLHFFGAVLVPFFTEWGHIQFTQIMILQSWFVFISFVAEVPTGTVADFLGRKWSLAAGAIINIIGVVVYTITPSLMMFFLAEALWGIAIALYSGANEAIIYDSLKRTKQEFKFKKIFGRIRSVHIAGITVAVLAGSFIAAKMGLEWPMRFCAIPLTIAFFISLSIKEPVTQKKKESLRYIEILRDGIKYFYKHKILKILAFDEIPISLLAFYIIWTYQVILTDINFNLAYFGIVHAGMAIAQIILLNTISRWEWIFGSKKNYLFFASLIPAIGFVILGLSYSPYVVVPAIVLVATFGLTRRVVFASYYNKYIDSHNRSTVLSTIAMTNKFARALIYPLVGVAVDWNPRITLIIIGGTLLLFAITSRIEEEMLLD